MRKWKCEHCGDEQEALCIDMAHRCPSNRNQLTSYKQIGGPKLPPPPREKKRATN